MKGSERRFIAMGASFFGKGYHKPEEVEEHKQELEEIKKGPKKGQVHNQKIQPVKQKNSDFPFDQYEIS